MGLRKHRWKDLLPNLTLTCMKSCIGRIQIARLGGLSKNSCQGCIDAGGSADLIVNKTTQHPEAMIFLARCGRKVTNGPCNAGLVQSVKKLTV